MEPFTVKVNNGAKIRNRYNQVPHLTQDTKGKVTNSQLDTTNESQEVSPFPAGETCLKRQLNKKTKIGFQDQILLNSTSIKPPPIIKIFVLSIFEWRPKVLLYKVMF